MSMRSTAAAADDCDSAAATAGERGRRMSRSLVGLCARLFQCLRVHVPLYWLEV